MRRRLQRMFRSECAHEKTLIVKSVGVSRTVCETCGHISFEIAQDLGKTRQSIVRSQLERVS